MALPTRKRTLFAIWAVAVILSIGFTLAALAGVIAVGVWVLRAMGVGI